MIQIETFPTKDKQSLTFDIKGDKETGLHKSVINSIRRTLLSSIPSVAFRTLIDESDIHIVKNTTSLHNEFMLHRISMIPLYINPSTYKKNYLFSLKVEEAVDLPIRNVTANDFQIFPLKQDVNPDEIKEIQVSDYQMDNPLSDEEKQNIFRPFSFKGKNHYCIITELKKSMSEKKQALELYGVPSISYAYEDARWQSVSRASYLFKKNEELFQSIFQEKLQLQNIPEEEQENFKKSLEISESERYFHRDLNMEPYWYSFTIDAVHHHKPKDLFIQACEIIIEQLSIIKEEFSKLPTGKESIIDLESKQGSIYHITLNGYDDTIGNILQTHIVNHQINDETSVGVCGYKKVHPLEDKIKFIVSLNMNHPVSKLSEPQKVNELIKVFHETCDELSKLYQEIIQSANDSM
tara:strand:+ start:7330 stop:8553 length:1224 start_codon:yes stop_codon:yes gene_type:complete